VKIDGLLTKAEQAANSARVLLYSARVFVVEILAGLTGA
jgi:hypothetical protein